MRAVCVKVRELFVNAVVSCGLVVCLIVVSLSFALACPFWETPVQIYEFVFFNDNFSPLNGLRGSTLRSGGVTFHVKVGGLYQITLPTNDTY